MTATIGDQLRHARTALLFGLLFTGLTACTDTAESAPDQGVTTIDAARDLPNRQTRDTVPVLDAAADTTAADTSAARDTVQTLSLSVTYRLVNESGSLSCAEGKATWADVYLARDGTTLRTRENGPCDDAPVVFDGLHPGAYSIEVVVWDVELWTGRLDGFVLSVGTTQALVELSRIPH